MGIFLADELASLDRSIERLDKQAAEPVAPEHWRAVEAAFDTDNTRWLAERTAIVKRQQAQDSEVAA